MNNDIVAIKLDKERTLKFRRKELKRLENIFGKKISQINFEDIDIDGITKMIHAGLLHEDESLTLEKAEELIDSSDMSFGELTKAVMDAFSISMGGPRISGEETKN
ncbi:tail assembly chaperone [Dehalobacter sp. DCM]|uniref:hypothetical protein n=1 Tax=Dehalobacter sp. DCM TaxID=2907827 RepID=UPI0030820227|nr:tail assembly chaperone [Dehalobacter sp. DCM]